MQHAHRARNHVVGVANFFLCSQMVNGNHHHATFSRKLSGELWKLVDDIPPYDVVNRRCLVRKHDLQHVDFFFASLGPYLPSDARLEV